MWPILPSSRSCLSVPIWSAKGTEGSTRCSWKRGCAPDPASADSTRPAGAGTRGGRWTPPARSRAGQPGLGGDHHIVRIGVQGLAEELLRRVGTVGIRGVEQGHAQLDGPAQDAHAGVLVREGAPDAGTGELHGSVAEAVHRQFAAQGERAGGRGGRGAHRSLPFLFAPAAVGRSSGPGRAGCPLFPRGRGVGALREEPVDFDDEVVRVLEPEGVSRVAVEDHLGVGQPLRHGVTGVGVDHHVAHAVGGQDREAQLALPLQNPRTCRRRPVGRAPPPGSRTFATP